MSESSPIIEVKNLKKFFGETNRIFKRKREIVRAVDGVSFTINRGETFGLVGESGSGKSTIGRSVLRLDSITSGEVLYHGQNLHELTKKEVQKLRPKIQFIFQDPYKIGRAHV